MDINPQVDYKLWYDQAILKLTDLKKQSSLLSWLRLLIFIGFIVFAICAFIYTTLLIYLSLIFLAVFIYLLVHHDKVNYKIDYQKTYSECLEQELSAIDHKYSFNSGDRYIDPEHPFTWDLDIFGNNSIFNSLNRTVTRMGTDKLAKHFINPSLDPRLIKRNQEAIKELSAKHRWLLDFRTYGILGAGNDKSEQEIINWAGEKPMFSSAGFLALLYIVPAISILMTLLVSVGIVTTNTFMLYMFIPLIISGIFAARITKRHNQVSRKAPLLNNYASRFKMTEKDVFTSALMNEIQLSLTTNNKTASQTIKKLSRIISSMDARLNWLMWIILNFLLLWDIRQMVRLEQWQRKYKNDLPLWFEAISNIEALGSLAGFAILNAAFTYPDPDGSLLTIKAENAGHPLIPPTRRIDNTVEITGKGNFNIVTGANMAGKSTYLRTTGINLVLAMTGAPVCASKFIFFPAIPYTSLHTLDSLSTNKSYFFAELERLKLIIDTLNSGQQIYVFLDEILKGTNSYDKQNGSKALLRQLVNLGASGMIATHDLDLGQLEQSFPENITNYCFEAVIINNELYFDYKLNRGIAKNMNATFLMKHMGITV